MGDGTVSSYRWHRDHITWQERCAKLENDNIELALQLAAANKKLARYEQAVGFKTYEQ